MMSCVQCYVQLMLTLNVMLNVVSEDVKVIRASSGDQFPITSHCNSCSNYNAFCSTNFCQCFHGLSYFFDGNKQDYLCMNKSQVTGKCLYEIRNRNISDNFFFQFSNFDLVLGKLFKRNSNVKPKTCNLNTVYYDAVPNWVLGDISDFNLVKSKNFLTLNFLGDNTKYYGKLLKVFLTCGGKKSCLMLKFEGKMIGERDERSEIITTTKSPQNFKKKEGIPNWIIGLIIGVVILIIFVGICVVVFIKRRKRKPRQKKSQKVKQGKFKEPILSQTDNNRNSIHDQVAMYVSHENHVELSSAYVDPDLVFNRDSSEKVKNPNYDYAYSGLPKPPLPAEKHEYMVIVPDHPYTDPDHLPCPDSRKSLGYAILKGVDNVDTAPLSSPTLSSEYQALSLEQKADPLLQNSDEKKSPSSPKYFQLDCPDVEHAV